MKKPKQPKKQQGSWMSRQKPGFLTGSVSGRQALKEIKAAQNLEYRPLERSIQGDLAGSAQRQRDIPGWFQQYQNTLQNGANQTAAAYSQAQQQLSDRMNQAGSLDQSNRADMQQRGQADAALRGVAYNPQSAQDSTNTAAARQTSQAGYGGMIGTLGANQSAYLSDKQRIGAGEQINQLLKEQTRERGIRSDLRELKGKEGDFATKYLADLRESERKYALGKATLKGENSRAALSASTSRRGQDLTRQSSKEGHATTQRGQNISAAQQEANRKASNRRDRKNRRQDAKQNAQNNKQQAKDNKGKGKSGKGGR